MQSGETPPEYLALCVKAVSTTPETSRVAAVSEVNARNSQAFLLEKQNRLEEAERLRREVISQAGQLMAPGDELLLKYRLDCARLLLKMQRYDEAEAQFQAVRDAVADAPDERAALPPEQMLVETYQRWRTQGRAGLTSGPAGASQPGSPANIAAYDVSLLASQPANSATTQPAYSPRSERR